MRSPVDPNTPLDEAELSFRAHKALQLEGCLTTGDVARKTDGELLRIPNFGRVSLREVRAVCGFYDESCGWQHAPVSLLQRPLMDDYVFIATDAS